jgi:uronate dehydrogenase
MNNRFDRLLLTGAAGQLGCALREPLKSYCHTLRLSDKTPLDTPAGANEEWVCCDLADPAATAALLAGVDAVVHLGGQATEADWTTIMDSNIAGAYHLWEAARRAGTQRIVFASSNHAIGFHRRSQTLDERSPVRPDSRYGLSKVFGEALARLYADKYSIKGFCIRIGSCFPEPSNRRMLSTWLSYRDLAQLVGVGLTADYHFEIVYGASANDRGWWDNSRAFALGYAPQDNAERWRAQVDSIEADDPVARSFQGGDFAAVEFTGDIDAIG